MKTFLAACFLILTAGTASAQQGTAVTQAPTKLDAATFLYGQANGATSCNTVSQTAAQDTVTIPAQAGLYIYITGFYMQLSTNATGVTQVGTISTTNITGAPFWSYNTALSTTGQDTINLSDTFPTGLKAAQPGVAVTFVPSATQSAANYLCIRVAGFYAQ